MFACKKSSVYFIHLKPFKAQTQTALVKGPVRTAL